ncbi:MAG: histidine phosphatase family protein [Chloroflexi bacterium]|nr:histidine phosphatase family protein [Chloroflexota bacterium]
MTSRRLMVIVRHAESEHHVRRLTGGWTDTPLTEAGHEQARVLAARLAAELAGHRVSLYSSDLKRAAQTAQHIGEAFGEAVAFDQRLREHNNGAAANMTIEAAAARYPETWAVNVPLDTRAYEGAETPRQFYERAGAFIDQIEADGSVPVVVTHGGTMICLVARWLRLSAETLQPIGFSAHTTSITVLSEDRHGRQVERLNDTAHLYGSAGHVRIGDLV